MSKLFVATLFFVFGQLVGWYQSNGPVISKWMNDNILLCSILIAPFTGIFFAYGTKMMYEELDQLWSVRFIAFACGYLVFIPLAWWHLGESPFTLKNLTSMFLCVTLISIQFLMK
jgi:hypothetical protein